MEANSTNIESRKVMLPFESENSDLETKLEEIRSRAKAYLALPRNRFYLTEYQEIQKEEEAMLQLIKDSKGLQNDTKMVNDAEEAIKSADKQIKSNF